MTTQTPPEALKPPTTPPTTPRGIEQMVRQHPEFVREQEQKREQVNQEFLAERQKQYRGPEAIQRIKNTTQKMQKELVGGENGLEKRWQGMIPTQGGNLEGMDHVDQKVTEVMGLLQEEGPDEVGGAANPRALYLLRKGSGEKTEYFANLDKINADRAALQGFLTVYKDRPEITGFLTDLIATLDLYAKEIDPMQVQYQQAIENVGPSPEIREQGSRITRMGIFIVAIIHMLITGVMSIAKGQFPTASLFSGGLAYLAFKGKDLLRPAEQRIVQSAVGISETLRGYPFLRGENGRAIVEHLMGNPSKALSTFMNTKDWKLKTPEQKKEIRDELIGELLGQVPPENVRQSDPLCQMIDSDDEAIRGQFITLVQTIRGARDAKTKALVLDSVATRTV